MRYVWNPPPRPDKRRVMHVATYDRLGQMTGYSLCGRGPFFRSINAPFGLGRRICKDCQRKQET